ncbi:glycosyltransferase family 2 protein [bacterium]|nr:glycosyltransferase family 2 protein [bacterium]
MQPEVSIIIIHFGSLQLTHALVSQLLALPAVPSREIIVVDNASGDPFPGSVYPTVRVVRLEENRGYGYACNRGAAAASGAFLLICNNDLEFRGNPLPALTERCATEKGIGAVGPALRFPDDRFQLSWGRFPTLLSEFFESRRQQESREGGGSGLRKREQESATVQEVDWVTGACVLVPRQAWDSISGFDERYFFYFEDVDLCMRLRRRGWKVLYDPTVTITHHGGGSNPLANPSIVLSYRREQLRFYARYNSSFSFFLLRRYLLLKFRRLVASGEVSTEFGTEMENLINGFSRNEERRMFHAREKRTS